MNVEKVRELFVELVANVPPERWQERLAVLVGDDEDTRQRVQLLLAAHREDSFLASPAPGLGATIAEPSAERPGTVIGPYKLLEQIGEGGFGIVFMAEQQEPIRRKVALKVLKPGMDTRQVITRFEAERQALALMDHPNIAKILDAGTTEPISDLRLQNADCQSAISNLQSAISCGRPYFVMDLVKGVPITEYCDQAQLTTNERLELFVHVCQAVQHAHQKGIIHRDIKPTNVLITRHDATPVVKVIDFGIAKAMGQQLTEKTLFTNFAQMVGTPLYMSPEQAGMSDLDVDTRSDIYSLGVLLYELLTGTTPFDKERFKEAGYDEIRRIVREEEPPKPSTRVSTLAQAATTISTQRKSDPKRLSQLFRGELDWIVMKALEKDRNRRYETASAFAADVQRYLQDEPVLACPPSARYRLRKFVRRNKAALVTVSMVVAALVAGTAVATWQAVIATRAKQDAVTAVAAEKKARETAEMREAETEGVLEFVENKVIAAARPEGQDGGLGREVTLRRAVEAALPFVAKSFTNQPLIEARLRLTLGTSFLYLSDARTAAEQYEAAYALFTKHLDPEHPHTLLSIHGLANSYHALGRSVEAMQIREETLALCEAKLGHEHPHTLGSMSNLANSYHALGRYAEALQLREETLALRKAKFGPDNPDTVTSTSNLAFSYEALGRYADALKLREEVLARRKAALGPDNPDTLRSMNNLANSYASVGRYADSLRLYEETLALRKVKLGPDHRFTLESMNNVASIYYVIGRHAEALKLHEETLLLRKNKLGSDHPDTLASMTNLATSYAALGRHADAVKLYEQTVAIMKGKLSPDHPDMLRTTGNLANSYEGLGRHAEAIKLHEQTLTLMKAKLGPPHPDTLTGMTNLAHSYEAVGRYADALKLVEEALPFQKAELGPVHPDIAASTYGIACLHALMIPTSPERAKQADLAIDWLKKAVAAGFKNVDHMKKDKDLDLLRNRTDFQKVLADLEARKGKDNK